MATNYPGSLDSGTQQPSPSASTEMDDSGFEHDVVHTNHSGALIALETKVGTGDSNAVANSVLAGTGSGTSGWTTGTLANAISGNAATATALATARTIGGVSFDGTGNINLPGVNTAGNQATSGLAATATALATARAINGVNFDGTAAITVTADANTLSNTTLKSTVVASSLTSVGTLASLQVTGLTAAVGKMVVGQASFTQEPWNASTIALGAYGSIGTQGSHRASLAWNYERGTDSGWHALGVNSYSSAAGIDLGNDGILFRADTTYGASNQPTTRMIVTPAGDVGIGTTSPDEALEVAGQMLVGTSGDITPDASGNGQIMINANGYTGFMAADATGIWVGSNSGSRATILATNETARLTVMGDGRVAIAGAAITARTFSIRGTTTSFETRNESSVSAGGVTGGVILIGAAGNSTNPDTGDYWLLFRRGNGSTIGSVRGTGSASVSFSTTSDATLKTDNGPVDEARIGGIIDDLRIHDFDWIDGDVNNQIGVFAQEAIKVLPDSIVAPPGEDDEGNYLPASLDYSKIVPILVAECQFLRQRVAALETV